MESTPFIYNSFKQKRKQFAVLIDPDKYNAADITGLLQYAQDGLIDYFFVGGSLLTEDYLEKWITLIKNNTQIPVILFPGNTLQICPKADAILFLSLISGRNPEMLIGKHVIAAPYLKSTTLKIIPTGYMLIDSGKQTAASYMSNSQPIPADKHDIAVCTAMAGEMLGLKVIYMDAGSGAINPVSEMMIREVRKHISVPLIIGGGIDSPEKAQTACSAGADIIVVGNAIEKNPNIITSISTIIKSYQ
ncbi:MAG: geranylgeranylglyceryl/heptaprenylglyceryl phosphate synthase [Bacteroidota bacterium]